MKNEKLFSVLNTSLETINSLNEIKNIFKDKINRYEVTKTDISLLNLSVFHISNTLGVEFSTPSLESVEGGIYRESELALESLNEFIKSIWKRIVNFFSAVINKLKMAISNKFTYLRKASKLVELGEKEIKGKEKEYNEFLDYLNKRYGSATLKTLTNFIFEKANNKFGASNSYNFILNAYNYPLGERGTYLGNDKKFILLALIQEGLLPLNEKLSYFELSKVKDLSKSLNETIDTFLDLFDKHYFTKLEDLIKTSEKEDVFLTVKNKLPILVEPLTEFDNKLGYLFDNYFSSKIVNTSFNFIVNEKSVAKSRFYFSTNYKHDFSHFVKINDKRYSNLYSSSLVNANINLKDNNIKNMEDLYNHFKFNLREKEMGEDDISQRRKKLDASNIKDNYKYLFEDNLSELPLPSYSETLNIFKEIKKEINNLSKKEKDLHKAYFKLKDIIKNFNPDNFSERQQNEAEFLISLIKESMNFFFNSLDNTILNLIEDYSKRNLAFLTTLLVVPKLNSIKE